jgi:hypothetical protein
MATTVATGKRIPRMHGMPPITAGSTVMRVYVTTVSAYRRGVLLDRRRVLDDLGAGRPRRT